MSDDLDRRAAIAMGRKCEIDDVHTVVPWQWSDGTWHKTPPPFKTDMNAAMELVKRANEAEFLFSVVQSAQQDMFISIAFGCHPTVQGTSSGFVPLSSMPEAITEAFLELYDNGKLGEKI